MEPLPIKKKHVMCLKVDRKVKKKKKKEIGEEQDGRNRMVPKKFPEIPRNFLDLQLFRESHWFSELEFQVLLAINLEFLGIFGNFWEFLGISGNFWEFLGISGNF